MNYKIYIIKNCPSCEKVVRFIQEEKIECEVIDDEEKLGSILIFPCLKKNDQPLAYGLGVMDYLKQARG